METETVTQIKYRIFQWRKSLCRKILGQKMEINSSGKDCNYHRHPSRKNNKPSEAV